MDFTSGEAKGLVIGATAGAAILASAANLFEGQPPSIRTAMGAAIAASLLYAMSDWVPTLAGSLALVLLLGAILTHGETLAQVVNRATGE